MPTPATISISAAVPVTTKDLAVFFSALDNAYTHLRFLELVIEEKGTQKQSFMLIEDHFFGRDEDLAPELYLSPADALVLSRASFNSPGVWEFLGSLNPLQQIREYLNDRHARRQDREYREELEKRKLQFENDRLQTENLDRQIEIFLKAGYPKSKIRRMLNTHYYGPLDRLASGAEKAGIAEATVQEARTGHRSKNI